MVGYWLLVAKKRCSEVVKSMSQGCISVFLLPQEFLQEQGVWTSHSLLCLKTYKRKVCPDSINSPISRTDKFFLQMLDDHHSSRTKMSFNQEIAQSQWSKMMNEKATYFKMKLLLFLQDTASLTIPFSSYRTLHCKIKKELGNLRYQVCYPSENR